MLITKREEVTKQGFCKILWRKLLPRESVLLEFIHSSGWGGGERLFEAGHLLTFSAFRMGAYSNKYGKRYKFYSVKACIKRKKFSLPVNVRPSKTPLLKFSRERYFFLCGMIFIQSCYTIIAISYKNNIKSQPLKIVGKLVEKLHVERLHTSQLIWRAP